MHTTNNISRIRESFPDAAFRKSSYSGRFDGNSNCVEIAVGTDVVGVRDSKQRSQEVLLFSRSEWHAFVMGAKAGEFDLK
jgi:hypothetical protein